MTRRVHLVGIGGAGMSAIAKVLHGRGDHVTGSDRAASPYSAGLEALGINVAYRHAAENLGDVDLVLASSAIPATNVELEAARERGIPILRRDAFLPDLTAGYDVLAVAGTHGKTTTSGLIAWLMVQAGLDPSFMVGGILRDLETNARTGGSAYFVIEADEYDRAFLGLKPQIAVVTNIEHDHPDCYPTMDDFRAAFVQFGERVQDTLIVCQDDPGARDLPSPAPHRLTYGLDPLADWRAEEVRLNSAGGSDFLVIHGDETLGLARTRIPGLHNVRNALAALATLSVIGLSFREVREALGQYQGVGRRFQILGAEAGVTVIDDYAHHPTEIMATLQTARERYPTATIWAVFQPHTYSRVRTLVKGFARSFDDADHVIVLDVFAAREQIDPVYTGEEVASKIEHPDVCFVSGLDQAASMLFNETQAEAVVITLSAGDGNQVGVRLLKLLIDDEGERDHG
jgi:UDP-N-acetylmuramate--alanine ligase